MSTAPPQLVSKKKFVVNKESFFSAPRDPTDYTSEVSSFDEGVYETANNTNYFSTEDVDKVRVVLGRNWDYRKRNPNDVNKVFSSQWSAPRTAYNSHITLEPCEDHPTGPTEKISLKSWAYTEEGALATTAERNERFQNWLYYIKTGATTATGIQYKPIVQTNKWFFDHHHESFSPFTSEELENKQTVGKAFFANVKTYYNERIDSSDFESVTGKNPRIQNSLPSIYGFLRLMLSKGTSPDQTLDLGERYPARQGLYGALSVFLLNLSHTSDTYTPLFGTESFSTYEDLYIKLLKKYPLETLLTLYGSIGTYFNLSHHSTTGEEFFWPPVSLGGTGKWGSPPTKIIEKIITLNFDNFDADSLFSDYFKEYTSLINVDARLNPSEEWLGHAAFDSLQGNWSGAKNRIIALERIMTNLVFTPDSLKFLNKVDQYKKHFPFYAELEFTANISTALGDSMKKFFLTKFVSEAILSNLKPPESDQSFYGDTWTGIINNDPGLLRGPRPYVDFVGDSASGLATITSKTSIDFPELFVYWLPVGQPDASWLTAEGVHTDAQQNAQPANFSVNDLRNYTTFFRNDFSEPVNIDSDDNVIFKKLFGSAFYAKILETYENNKRTYREILDGTPAYSEDLFYRIEKIRKFADSDEEVVQNILIPNTSELDVVKYVDTQLKYSNQDSNNVTYKYNIYVHRVVFGSKHRYLWLDQEDQPLSNSKQTFSPVNLNLESPETTTATVEDIGAGLQAKAINTSGFQSSVVLYATFQVEIQPDIKIIEDKIFSTPDIIIIDKPPVVPDVNIVPYRAVNNRILILLSGASDRYRMKPIIMLEGDEEEFNKVKAAQLSFDDKVEFGSDDPVKNFQIFRTRQKPTTYSDFELYDQTSKQFYDETILPNTKYYYTFRAIDDHDHISNPSPVYEVELIDEKGAVKPIIRLIDMEPKKNKTAKKDCQKYIYLKPALKQLYLSDNPEVDSIFSSTEKRKKYRMRLTSKGSGKKIDINFSFKKKIQTDETLIE